MNEVKLIDNYYPAKKAKLKMLFSENFFATVCAHSKYAFERVPLEDDFGIDFRIKSTYLRNGNRREGIELLRFQLKSTEKWKIDDNKIKYSLENKTYNDIVDHNILGDKPLILVLMCLPKNHTDWLTFDTNKCSIHKNIYWYHTNSKQQKLNEKSRTTIEIPLIQRFDFNTITNLISEFSPI